MAFGSEYSSDYAYFIAGGGTLEAIKKYEANKKNVKAMQSEIVKDFNAKSFSGLGSSAYLDFDKPVDNPALQLEQRYSDKERYVYKASRSTPEGKALQARFDDIPEFDLGQKIFAKRVTGAEELRTNPDNLSSGYGGISHYGEKATATPATFEKIGDAYVVSVPRVIRGIFNAASEKASKEDHYNQAAGYTYEWWTPPDSTPIPYSKLVELREKEKGDQLVPRTVMQKVPAFSSDR